MASWNDVQTNPEFQKLPPQEKEAARDQYFKQVVAPKVPPDQLTAVRTQFDKDTAAKTPPGIKDTLGAIADRNMEVGAAETAAHMASGAASLPVAAGASLYKLATAPWGSKAQEAAKASSAVEQAMTYQPRTTAGKTMTGAAGAVLGVPGQIGEAAEQAVENNLEGKGIPKTAMTAEVAARMVPEVAATLLGAGDLTGARAAAAKGATRSVAAEAAANLKAAQDYVASKTNMKWEDIPAGTQKLLKTAARDPKELEKLDPATVEREARAARLGMPITRGDADRNLGQQTREDLVKKEGNQNPIRDIRSAQDTALHGKMDEVRKDTGAEAKTHEQIGQSVQDAGIRAKATASKKAYDDAFDNARKTEPNATVPADPLYEALTKDPDIQHLGFVETWLRKAKVERPAEGGSGAPISTSTDIGKAVKARDKGTKGGGGEGEIERRPITLNELQDLREKAAGIARSAQGSDKYFAGKLVKAIDKSFDKIPPAAKAWKEARSLYKKHQEEFEEQGIVKALGADKRKSSDRRVPVEKTVAKVLSSSKEDIGKLKTTLTKGGTEQTRKAGERAWKNVQAGVLDELRKAAAGKRKIKGEKGQAQFNSSFLDKFNELNENGKIDAIFTEKQAAKLREIAKGVEDVRTKADKGISGTDTAQNLRVENTLSNLEKLAKVPYGGKYVAGAAKFVGNIRKAGETEREFARAKTTPVREAADTARSKRAATNKKAARKQNTLKTLDAARRTGVAASPLTLQDQNDQR